MLSQKRPPPYFGRSFTSKKTRRQNVGAPHLGRSFLREKNGTANPNYARLLT
jgi:hypothetical protein